MYPPPHGIHHPEQLRQALQDDHKLLKLLIDDVSRTMKQLVKARCKAIPRIICILHPYGKDLTLNPHVHVLATEGLPV